MKKVFVILGGLIFLLSNSILFALNSSSDSVKFPKGLSISYGIGSYAHTDEYISKEKYSGALPNYTAGFTKQHEKYIYHVEIGFRSASHIKNYNVSAEVIHFSLNQNFLYPLPEFLMFSKSVHAYLGPSTEIFVYTNKQNIAVSGFDYAQSFAALLSLGMRSDVIYPLTDKFSIESSLEFNVLSLGLRMVDTEETDESPAKPLTLFSGLHGIFSTGLRYYLLDNLSMKASYLFAVTKISAWNPLQLASDNLILTVTYGF